MKGKFWILICSIFIMAGIIWFFYMATPPKAEIKSEVPPTKREEVRPPVEATTIAVQEIPPTPSPTKEAQRKILGPMPKEGLRGLHFLNTPSLAWKEKYTEELKRFQDPENKIELTLQESGIQILPNKTAIYIEKVLVIIRHPSGQEDSFNALINSSTGKVIQTFNYVKRDDLPLPGEERKGMTPTGVIKNNP